MVTHVIGLEGDAGPLPVGSLFTPKGVLQQKTRKDVWTGRVVFTGETTFHKPLC